MNWSDRNWKEGAVHYHAERGPTRLSEAEFRRWRCESGLDDDRSTGDDMNSGSEKGTEQPAAADTNDGDDFGRDDSNGGGAHASARGDLRGANAPKSGANAPPKRKPKSEEWAVDVALPFTAEELDKMRFDPINFVVPGYIVEGLTLFAGKPKIGKSWLLLHAAIAVARGGFTLGDVHCQEGDVLYCALEDNKRRLQSRMTKLLGTSTWPPRLCFACEMPRLTEGGLDYIKKWVEGAKQPRLVVIDVLAMVRMPNRKDLSTYDADYQAVKELRTLAHKKGIAVVLVHHLRKADADDAFDTVSGTLGLTGAPDTILVLKRDGGGNIILHGRGRDLIEIEKAMSFNKDACTWTIAGEVSQVRTSGERRAILSAMREIGAPATPTEIAAIARLKPVNVRRMMLKMAKDGLVQKSEYGKYEIGTVTASAAE